MNHGKDSMHQSAHALPAQVGLWAVVWHLQLCTLHFARRALLSQSLFTQVLITQLTRRMVRLGYIAGKDGAL